MIKENLRIYVFSIFLLAIATSFTEVNLTPSWKRKAGLS
jgi:hypothetical protein